MQKHAFIFICIVCCLKKCFLMCLHVFKHILKTFSVFKMLFKCFFEQAFLTSSRSGLRRHQVQRQFVFWQMYLCISVLCVLFKMHVVYISFMCFISDVCTSPLPRPDLPHPQTEPRGHKDIQMCPNGTASPSAGVLFPEKRRSWKNDLSYWW